MSACEDLIFFDNADDWEQIVNIVKEAEQPTANTHYPISQFDLDVSIDNSYVAVLATTTKGKSTWRFAGELRQTFDFAAGGNSSLLNKAQSAATPLFINKFEIVKMSKITPGNYKLRYQPPTWFKDCGIRVYRYTGDRLNFIEDTLFNIGNQIGNGVAVDLKPISNQINALQSALDDSYLDLTDDIDELSKKQESNYQQIITEINQLDAGVFTIADGIGYLLPNQQAQEIRSKAQQRLNLNLGFL